MRCLVGCYDRYNQREGLLERAGETVALFGEYDVTGGGDDTGRGGKSCPRL